MNVIALLLAASIAQPAPQACDFARNGSRTSLSGTHIDTDDDKNSYVLTFSRSDGRSCRSATIVGRVRFNEAEDDVAEIPFGAQASFTERTGDDSREVAMTRASDGSVARNYRRNGQPAAFDADARRWIASIIPSVLMEAGINAAPRVARWRAQGGVDNVLALIGTIESSGAKRTHYEALLAGQLADAEYDRVIRHAGRNLQSSGDLRGVLLKAAPRNGGGRNASALEDAASRIASSGDRKSVLEVYGNTSDREMLASVMRVARTIPSSGDKASLLQQLAPRYLKDTDRSLQELFYETAETIQSSGDLRSVLREATPFAATSPEQALLLIGASRHIASSGDRSSVLIALVENGGVKAPRVRDAFLSAAESVQSAGDRSRVLQAVVRY